MVADTVNTMPEKTLQAFANHGEVEGDKVTDTPSAAPEVFDALKRVGIDITAACQVLQDETVSTFEASSRGNLLDTTIGQLNAAS